MCTKSEPAFGHRRREIIILPVVLLLIQLLEKHSSLTEQFVVFRGHAPRKLFFLRNKFILLNSRSDPRCHVEIILVFSRTELWLLSCLGLQLGALSLNTPGGHFGNLVYNEWTKMLYRYWLSFNAQ